MKLIHCADLHLDSRMTSNLDRERAKERKNEILHTFERMVNYAASHQVTGILIAGDLFDTRNVSVSARNVVIHSILAHPEILFFYLRGNHDSDNFLSELSEVPENLKLFTEHWTSYALGSVVIHGTELNSVNSRTIARTLTTDPGCFNIVMLHGQESDSSSSDRAEIIDLRSLRGKGIDYLALGHIHSYRMEPLDTRGIRCYPGCLEGRGFDECGSHGFVLLEIDESARRCRTEFVPFAARTLHTVPVDVTACMNTAEMVPLAREAAEEAGCRSCDLVKFVLTGSPDIECEKDPSYLTASLADSFYYVKTYDETTPRICPEDYIHDESLKGEFIRTIMEDHSLSEADRMSIIRFGLQALAGEEICG